VDYNKFKTTTFWGLSWGAPTPSGSIWSQTKYDERDFLKTHPGSS